MAEESGTDFNRYPVKKRQDNLKMSQRLKGNLS